MSDLEGVILSEYLLLKCISRGGTSDVYRARQQGGRNYEVAAKVFRPGYAQRKPFRDYFMAEADKIGQLDHPNILPFLEFGEGEGLLPQVAARRAAPVVRREAMPCPADPARDLDDQRRGHAGLGGGVFGCE